MHLGVRGGIQFTIHVRVAGLNLTLKEDMAGSLLYLSMVWNLVEWLSSWYSSECLLRVCITFCREGENK